MVNPDSESAEALTGAVRSPASVSAAIASANAHLSDAAAPAVRFPGEDGGRSLAEMARRDLDAALQLLAERAQYITGASGAAIALRRGQNNDMLCRASSGSNAPELGALLSMEHGLSGESVRTRQTMRCDDTERDPRVNREGCRQLGIASVVIMPIVCEDQTLGVFELFSRRPNAFAGRDISALRRLSEMVETAVKHAEAAQRAPAAVEPVTPQAPPPEELNITQIAESDSSVSASSDGTATAGGDLGPAVTVSEASATESQDTSSQKPGAARAKEEAEAADTPIATHGQTPFDPTPSLSCSDARPDQQCDTLAVENSSTAPPILQGVQKCQGCGFPVSQGRTLCVECEEKQWRGQPLPRDSAESEPQKTSSGAQQSVEAKADAAAAPEPASTNDTASPVSSVKAGALETAVPSTSEAQPPPATDSSALFANTLPSESWLAANKYLLAVLLVVALVIAAIAWFR